MRAHQAVSGEWFTITRRGYRIRCCDCGMVHRIFVRVARNGRRTMEMRADRDDKKTREARRTKRWKKVRV